ncbi:MAG: hypothetical protein M1356_09245 [Gammaproteobacteria bacterium]|nr:hypothetical protein [Gammaproteobacteria bacterium]
MKQLPFNEIQQAIGKRVTEIGSIKEQITKLIPHNCNRNISINKFDIKMFGNEFEYQLFVYFHGNEVFYSDSTGNARVTCYDDWFDNFYKAVRSYIDDLENTRVIKHYTQLLDNARKLGIDTREYEEALK